MADTKNIEKIKELAAEKEVSELLSAGETEEIFAACFKAAEKHLHVTPYDEQLYAAYELCKGNIIEMKTGEGKTLSAVFAACLHAKNGGKVHVLTFNDYLAKRDYNWMKKIYEELSVSVGYITGSMEKAERQKMYKCDVLYITARECGFDFLRDFVAENKEDCVQCGFDLAIVDEADSIMIDEARVPLVIAGQTAVTPDGDIPAIYGEISKFDDSLYERDEEQGTIYLTPAGEDKCEELFITDGSGLYEMHNNELLTKITDCLKASFLLKRDVHYIVKDDSIRIIDEFTG
ncbi:MAG: DEAD/DEAH box helicase, partial [Ruminiclostridium sp.]|nr:DEAD/DEAH box helicase [Ruminiclostridium sp.]